jgi:hypothetical protein
MLDNNTYNVMAQLVKENKSLWRIKNSYKNDARNCEKCLKFWEELEKDKEKHIRDLENLLSHHV